MTIHSEEDMKAFTEFHRIHPMVVETFHSTPRHLVPPCQHNGGTRMKARGFTKVIRTHPLGL